MTWWRRSEIRLSFVLALGAALCMVVAGISYPGMSGQFFGAVSASMPLTIVILLWATRRLQECKQHRWLPASILSCSLAGLARPWLEDGPEPLGLAGVATGILGTIFLWALVDPLSLKRHAQGRKRFEGAGAPSTSAHSPITPHA